LAAYKDQISVLLERHIGECMPILNPIGGYSTDEVEL
jgi:hypothetical protein